VSADKFISEARARIIWGEPSLTVRDFLISNGVSDLVADAKVEEFMLERNRELRSLKPTGGIWRIGTIRPGCGCLSAQPLAKGLGLSEAWNKAAFRPCRVAG